MFKVNLLEINPLSQDSRQSLAHITGISYFSRRNFVILTNTSLFFILPDMIVMVHPQCIIYLNCISCFIKKHIIIILKNFILISSSNGSFNYLFQSYPKLMQVYFCFITIFFSTIYKFSTTHVLVSQGFIILYVNTRINQYLSTPHMAAKPPRDFCQDE